MPGDATDPGREACPVCLGSGAQCEACFMARARPVGFVGWRSRATGEICDCPPWESSPHANSDPVYLLEAALPVPSVGDPETARRER
jgi:hypothetical protein